MDDTKVISFGSRKSISTEEAVAIAEATVAKKTVDAKAEHKASLLKMLEDARGLVEQDKIQGLIIAGREPQTGAFYTDFDCDNRVVPQVAYLSFVGALETLKNELIGCAMMAPELMPDGSILDPYNPVPTGEGAK